MVDTDQSRPVAVPHGWADPALGAPAEPFWRRILPLLVWVLCLAVALGLLLALGDGRLAAPPLTDLGAWGAWATGRDPFEVAGVVLRLLALGLAWYLVGITGISVLARALRLVRLVRLADALSFGPVKVLAQQAAGVGLAVGVLATAVPGTAVTSVPAGAGSGPGDRTESAVASDEDVVTLVPLGTTTAPDPPATVQWTRAGGSAAAAAAADTDAAPDREVLAPVPAPEVAAAPTHEPGSSSGLREIREVRVEPGDHLWSLAERDVAHHLGRPGTEREVAAHWRTVVDANLDRLEVPGNPDLLLPGQVVVLPPVGEVGS